MPKKWILSLALALALMLPLAASAYTINDVTTNPPYTQAEGWRSGQVVGGNYNGTGIFQDFIGRPFATDSITFNFNPFSFTILTNNQPGGRVYANTNFGVADLAINYSSGNAGYDAYTLQHFPSAVSPFELGVDMQAYAAGTPGQAGNGVAWLANVRTWETSFSYTNPHPGLNYGGAYKSSTEPAAAKLQPVEVFMADADRYAQGTIAWVVNDPALDVNNNIPDYLITVTMPGIQGAPAEFLWGTARCANDIVHTPIPGTLLLLGSALIGLVGVGLRKKEST